MSDLPSGAAIPDPNQHASMTKRLGRLPAIDPRDRRFSMAAPPTQRIYRSWASPGLAWDQKETPMCVAYSTDRYLWSFPIKNQPIDFAELYRDCQENDEWPGTDYQGTSVRAAFKVLKRRGLVNSYGWATEPDQVVRHILEIGPVVLGIDWTDSMFDPDEHGYIHVEGDPVGGHAILAIGANRLRENSDGTRGSVRLLNSWGPEWGEHGRAWLSVDDLGKLLIGLDPKWPGEAATALEVRRMA